MKDGGSRAKSCTLKGRRLQDGRVEDERDPADDDLKRCKKIISVIYCIDKKIKDNNRACKYQTVHKEKGG